MAWHPPDAATTMAWAPPSRPRSLLARMLRKRGAPEGDERERFFRLARLNGPGQLRAALLALLARAGSAREQRAWHDETIGVVGAEAVLHDVLALPPAARVPWFEVFATRAAHEPLWQRSALVAAARRLMCADGRVDARDRLWWLALRRRLGEAPPAALGGAQENDLAQVDAPRVQAVAVYTGFLSRLVPHGRIDVECEAGARWYAAVMQRFAPRVPQPPLVAPDADATLRALRAVQSLGWMLRPVLVRAWFDEASAAHYGATLPIDAADALRLTCGLLDSPLPRGLERQYIEPFPRKETKA
jgi:hypothetical protein